MGQLTDEQRQWAISALNGFLSDLIQPSQDGGVTSVLQLFQQVVTTVPTDQGFLAEYYRSIPDIIVFRRSGYSFNPLSDCRSRFNYSISGEVRLFKTI